MKIARRQYGLAEPWNLAFQLEARDVIDAGALFPISAAAAVPDGLEPEPTDKGDQVDDDGNPRPTPKNRGRPAGAKNRPKQIDIAEASSSAAAYGSVPTAAAVPKKKRGRPLGSRNKCKPDQAAPLLAQLLAPLLAQLAGRGGSSRKI